MAQDEGPLFEAGINLKHKNFSLVNEVGGFRGYDAYEFVGITGDNDPVVYRLKILLAGKLFDWKTEFMTGLQDYHYNTFKMSLVYNFGSEKSE